MRTTAHRILCIAAAVFLLAQSAAVRALVECRMSGRVQTTCCCHSTRAAAPHTQQDDRFERPACCKVMAIQSSAVPASPQDSLSVSLGIAASSILLDLPAHRALPGIERVVRARSRAPPSGWPPLFIKHRSLLS